MFDEDEDVLFVHKDRHAVVFVEFYDLLVENVVAVVRHVVPVRSSD